MRRILAFVLIAIVLYGISTSPETWANAVEKAGSKAADVGSGWGTFITNVVS